jgi:hypothetical protein
MEFTPDSSEFRDSKPAELFRLRYFAPSIA